MNSRYVVPVIAMTGLLMAAGEVMATKRKGRGGGGSGGSGAVKLARKLKGHINTVNSVSFAKDGTTIASGGLDGTIRLWDAGKDKGNPTKTIPLPEGTILYQLAFHPRRGQIAAATAEGLLIFEQDGKQKHKLALGKVGGVEAVAYGPDGDSVAGVSAEGVQTWTSDDGVKIKTNTKLTNGKSVAYRPRAPGLVAVGRDGEIAMWYPSDDTTKTLEAPGEIISLAFSPDGKRLASFGSDRIVRCFDVDGGKQLWEKVDVANDSRLTFSTDGKLVISGAEGDMVRAFNADDGADAWQAKAPSSNTRVLAASPNGKLLASTGDTEILICTAK